MASWADVGRFALALPEVTQSTDTNGFKWEVRRTYFAWERPLRKRDVDLLGDGVPAGPILGVRVASLDDKRGLIGSNPDAFFGFPQSVDHPSVHVLLDHVSLEQLREVVTDAWLCRAPKRLAAGFLAQHPEL